MALTATVDIPFDKESFELIAQGAEGVKSISNSPNLQRLYKGTFLGENVLVKERIRKTYRHPALDSSIRMKRLVQVWEVMVMNCRKPEV